MLPNMGAKLFGRMVGLVVGAAVVAAATLLWIAVAADSPSAGDAPSEGLIWLGLGIVFTAERVVSVWKGGWPARLLAVIVVPELLFDMFPSAVYVKGIVDITRGEQGTWGHVAHAPAPARIQPHRRTQLHQKI